MGTKTHICAVVRARTKCFIFHFCPPVRVRGVPPRADVTAGRHTRSQKFCSCGQVSEDSSLP